MPAPASHGWQTPSTRRLGVGSRIADEMGWSRTFVGTLLIAGATSLPEIVVTLTALRLRALDIAIGGLLGSNLSDILIIAIDDGF